ncbi:MAG: lamin tail domain-containing protein [Anaerolineales bacterium]|nr:lamin tail domain-containing protein [Anaerolineales bacterium]
MTIIMFFVSKFRLALRGGLLCVLLLPLFTAASSAADGVPLRISEVFYNAPGADEIEEWVELVHLGQAPLPLDGIKLGDEEQPGGGEGMLRFPAEAVLAPGQVVVVAQSAAGFAARHGRLPDFEITPSDPAVPDMQPYPAWAGGTLALANGGDELLLLDAADGLIDALSYGDSHRYFDPPVAGVFAGQSIARVPADCDTDTAVDWQPRQVPTPGSVAFDGDCAAPLVIAPDDLPPIGALQGDGDVAPAVNQVVTFRGVVTGLLSDENAAGVLFHTLFLQDVPGSEDGDPATSDGMAVFLGRNLPAVRPGDQLRVTGQLTEFFGLTEIDDAGLQLQVEARDVPLPPPVRLRMPADAAARVRYLEALEGMRVATTGPMRVVGPTFGGCSLVVDAGEGVERPFRRHADDPVGPLLPILNHNELDCADFPQLKSFDRVDGFVGPLTYHFDEYKLVWQADGELAVEVAPLPALPAPPSLAANQFSVATVNLENVFDGVDDTGTAAEPKLAADELADRQAKLAWSLAHTLGCPTLVGVQEVENAALLAGLADAAADACGFTYAVTHRESADARGIDVALLSDPRRVRVTAVARAQHCTGIDTGIDDPQVDCPAGQWPLFSRPPLRVALMVDGEPLTLVVNHFKSKRGGEAETAARRLAQAAFVDGLAVELLAADEAAGVIVLGDFNDYEQSPALQRLAARLHNVLLQVPDAERYSFVFGGAAQLIDGILVSPALAPRLAHVSIAHVNADFPDTWQREMGAARLPYRATDHDLPLAVFWLAETAVASTPPTPPTPAATPTVAPPAALPAPVAGAKRPWGIAGGLALGGLLVFAGVKWRRRVR